MNFQELEKFITIMLCIKIALINFLFLSIKLLVHLSAHDHAGYHRNSCYKMAFSSYPSRFTNNQLSVTQSVCLTTHSRHTSQSINFLRDQVLLLRLFGIATLVGQSRTAHYTVPIVVTRGLTTFAYRKISRIRTNRLHACICG